MTNVLTKKSALNLILLSETAHRILLLTFLLNKSDFLFTKKQKIHLFCCDFAVTAVPLSDQVS